MKSPFRPLQLFGLIGLALLVVSTAGAIFASRNGSGAETGKSGGNGSGAAARSTVCYGNVDVEPGVTALYPLQPGRVVEVKVKDNDPVKGPTATTKGDELLRIDDRLAQFRKQEAEADLEAAKAQHEQAKKLPEQHEAKLAQQKSALTATQARLAGSRLLHARLQELLKIDQKNAKEVGAAAEQVKELEAAEQAEKDKLRELETVDPQVPVRRAQADVAAKQARLDQALLAVEECTLRAPRDGEVLQVLFGPGSVLGGQPNQPAIVFAPAGSRIVRTEVEQEFLGRVSVGQKVEIQDESSTAHTWTGKVTRLSDWFAYRRSQTSEPLRLNPSEIRTLECIVAIDPVPAGQPQLRLGQRVRVKMLAGQ